MPSGVKRGQKPSDISEEPLVDKFKMRDTLYVLTEVDAGSYSELMDLFTTVNEETGQEILDEDGFIRALTVKCMTRPNLTATELARRGQRLVRAIEGRVRRLHLAEEPVVTEGLEDDDEVKDPEEGNGD